MDEVHDDVHGDGAASGLGVDPVDLVVVAVHQPDPRAGVAQTAATSAIRFRSRFSPLDSRVDSLREAAADRAVAARNACGRITTPLPSADNTRMSSARPGAGRCAAYNASTSTRRPG